jgi:hypothetical protein
MCSFTALFGDGIFPTGTVTGTNRWLSSRGHTPSRTTPRRKARGGKGRERRDIAKTFAIGDLSKGQTKELIPAGEIFDVTIALVPIDTNLKLVGWEKVHELRENGSALVHLLPPE